MADRYPGLEPTTYILEGSFERNEHGRRRIAVDELLAEANNVARVHGDQLSYKTVEEALMSLATMLGAPSAPSLGSALEFLRELSFAGATLVKEIDDLEKDRQEVEDFSDVLLAHAHDVEALLAQSENGGRGIFFSVKDAALIKTALQEAMIGAEESLDGSGLAQRALQAIIALDESKVNYFIPVQKSALTRALTQQPFRVDDALSGEN